jgi:hypothetical protein
MIFRCLRCGYRIGEVVVKWMYSEYVPRFGAIPIPEIVRESGSAITQRIAEGGFNSRRHQLFPKYLDFPGGIR